MAIVIHVLPSLVEEKKTSACFCMKVNLCCCCCVFCLCLNDVNETRMVAWAMYSDFELGFVLTIGHRKVIGATRRRFVNALIL